METFIETKVQWETEEKAWVLSNGPVPLETASFKNHPALWSPENLFVASFNISFMQCFLEQCNKAGIPVLTYESRATGVTENILGKDVISEIILEPGILILNGTNQKTVLQCINAAKEKNIISNSMKTRINVQSKIDFKVLEEII
jgi:organic hydroperoxide reductase OsmC/OhrA